MVSQALRNFFLFHSEIVYLIFCGISQKKSVFLFVLRMPLVGGGTPM
jgi:hypothetical protein